MKKIKTSHVLKKKSITKRRLLSLKREMVTKKKDRFI